MKKSHLCACLAALSLVASYGTAFGQSNSTADGNWSAAIWNPVAPGNGTATGIINNVTFQAGDFWSGGAWPNGLLIGYNSWGSNWGLAGSGSGVLNVTGGTLITGYLGLGAGLNTLPTPDDPQTGTLNISGGTVTVDQEMLLGWSTAGGSSINVSGGTFTVAAGAGPANIGHGGSAAFTVSGGTATFNRAFGFVNSSTLTVSGTGTMNANVDHAYTSGTVNINGGTLNDVGYFNGATLNVGGGTINLNRAGGSHLSLSSTSTTTVSSGQLNSLDDLYLGLGGDGTVNQSGGTFSVAAGKFFYLTSGTGIAAYNQSGGTLEVGAIGSGGGTAAYNFSGGTLKAAGGLNLAAGGITTSITGTAGSGSTIDSNGNTVTVDATQIALGGSGVLTKTGTGSLTINNDAGFSTGTWNVNGGSVDMVGYFNGANVNVAGGTLNLNRAGGAHFSLSSASTATLSSGAINNTGDLYLGYAPGGNGTFNQSGGAFGVTGFFAVGGNLGAATWNISGGTQSITGALDVYENSAVNINSGGTLTKAPTIQNGGVVNVNSGGIIAEGAGVNSGGLLKFNGGNGAGVLGKYINLYGGTVDVNGQNLANRTWDAVISAAPGSKITNSSATAATIANTVAGNTIWLWDGAGGNTTIEAVGNLTIDSWITDTLQSTPQGIIKTGNGTLTLTFAGNNYRGDTTINAGTLSLSNPTLSDNATVTINGGTLNLNFEGEDQVDKAFALLGGFFLSELPPGLYNSSDGVGITGPGYLRVGAPVVSGYASWASAFSSPALSDTAATADPDYDGLTNAVEYALGLDPRFSSGSPGVASNGGKTITFTKGAEAKLDENVTYEIETSISLGVAPTPWTVNVADVTETADTIAITFPTPGPAKDFARLKVTLVP